MGAVLERFYQDKRLMPDEELRLALGWSPETLKAKRARREAPPSMKIKLIHLTRFDELERWLVENSTRVETSGAEKAATDIFA